MDTPRASSHYDRSFFDTLNDAGTASAAAVLPLVLDLVNPSSVVDVGCGTGLWSREAMRLGVAEVLGVDGAYVPSDQRMIPDSSFAERDLTQDLGLGDRRFDLAICLEVAEHLDARHADHLVDQLVSCAPAILFSAATPLQGGTDHVNEQWPEYWISRFENAGYTCWDALRPALRYRQEVAWIYRQNAMIVLGPEDPALSRMTGVHRLTLPEPGDTSFEYVARYLLEREDGLKATVQKLPALVGARLRRARSGR